MPDPLERLYENELGFIRKLGAEFAEARPKIAGRLGVRQDAGESEDPHVERLIESFAFLTARVRHKLEDEFPELTESLLGALYPHYLAPIPSLAIVQFDVDPDRGQLPKGHLIPRHSALRSRAIQGTRCQFRTAYPVTLWPISVVSARYQTTPFGRDVVPPPRSAEAKALIRMEWQVGGGGDFATLELDRLRFFLGGDNALAYKLHELIFNHVTQIVIRASGSGPQDPSLVLPAEALAPVGFERDEGLLPYDHRSFLGYRLLTEYFAFPRKFLFFDLLRLEKIRTGGFGSRVEVLFFLDRAEPSPEPKVSAETFRLGCAPIVNLFSAEADPIGLSHEKFEYLVTPDARNHAAMEVHTIERVSSTSMDTGEVVEYRPFHAFKHGADPGRQRAYWHARREPSRRRDDPGTEVYLSLVNLAFEPTTPPAEFLSVRALCTNRDLPARLRLASGERWEFELESQAPLNSITPLVNPTAPARLPPEQIRWRLISHLSLNHLSIVDETDGAEALKEILRLYAFGDNEKVATQHIDGIVSVRSRRKLAPVEDSHGRGFCRGIEVEIEFDEEKYVGGGVFLFASVLDRFLGLYATINSATRLVARLKSRKGNLKQWPFRAGEQPLL